MTTGKTYPTEGLSNKGAEPNLNTSHSIYTEKEYANIERTTLCWEIYYKELAQLRQDKAELLKTLDDLLSDLSKWRSELTLQDILGPARAAIAEIQTTSP